MKSLEEYMNDAYFILSRISAEKNKSFNSFTLEYYAVLFNVINALELLGKEGNKEAAILRNQLVHGYFKIQANDLKEFVLQYGYNDIANTKLFTNIRGFGSHQEAYVLRMDKLMQKASLKPVDYSALFTKAYQEDMLSFAKLVQNFSKNIQSNDKKLVSASYEACLCCLGLFFEASQQLTGNKNYDENIFLDYLKDNHCNFDNKRLKKDRDSIFHSTMDMPSKEFILKNRIFVMAYSQSWLEQTLNKAISSNPLIQQYKQQIEKELAKIKAVPAKLTTSSAAEKLTEKVEEQKSPEEIELGKEALAILLRQTSFSEIAPANQNINILQAGMEEKKKEDIEKAIKFKRKASELEVGSSQTSFWERTTKAKFDKPQTSDKLEEAVNTNVVKNEPPEEESDKKSENEPKLQNKP